MYILLLLTLCLAQVDENAYIVRRGHYAAAIVETRTIGDKSFRTIRFVRMDGTVTPDRYWISPMATLTPNLYHDAHNKVLIRYTFDTLMLKGGLAVKKSDEADLVTLEIKVPAATLLHKLHLTDERGHAYKCVGGCNEGHLTEPPYTGPVKNILQWFKLLEDDKDRGWKLYEENHNNWAKAEERRRFWKAWFWASVVVNFWLTIWLLRATGYLTGL